MMRAMNIRATALAVAFLMSLPLLGGCNTILLTRELAAKDGRKGILRRPSRPPTGGMR